MGKVVSGKRMFPHAYRLKPLACFGEFDLDGDLGRIRCLHTQKGGCLRLSSVFAF